MTILRVTLKPKLGSNRAIQDLLTSWIEWRGGEGDSVALSRSVWGANGQVFHAVSSHDSIGAADEFRQKVTGESRYQNMVQELSGHLLEPASWKLFDVLVPANRSGEPKPVSLFVSLRPSLGNIGDATNVLKDWVVGAQSRGMTAALLQQVWGSAGAMLAVRTAYDSIGQADENRQSLGESAEYQEFVAKLAPLMASPASWEVNEQLASSGM